MNTPAIVAAITPSPFTSIYGYGGQPNPHSAAAAPAAAKPLVWNDYLEVIFSTAADPADWVEAKSGADVDPDILTYFRGLIRNYFPGGPGRVASLYDIETFVRDEFNFATAASPPRIRPGFGARIILSSMFVVIEVQNRIREKNGVVAAVVPTSQNVTPVGWHVAVGETAAAPADDFWKKTADSFSLDKSVGKTETAAIDWAQNQGPAVCYACAAVQTSRRNASGVPVCISCSALPPGNHG